jgi:hypothetical protein
MELWTREDGRFMALLERPDLFGPAVQVIYGGWKSSRVRIIPVSNTEEADTKIGKLAKKRASHGYKLATIP